MLLSCHGSILCSVTIGPWPMARSSPFSESIFSTPAAAGSTKPQDPKLPRFD